MTLTSFGALVGAITGPLGLVVAFLAYWRNHKNKIFDVRSDLKKKAVDLHSLIERIPKLIDRAADQKLLMLNLEMPTSNVPTDSAERILEAPKHRVDTAGLLTELESLTAKSINTLSLDQLEDFGTHLHDIQSRAQTIETFFRGNLEGDVERIGDAIEQRRIAERELTKAR